MTLERQHQDEHDVCCHPVRQQRAAFVEQWRPLATRPTAHRIVLSHAWHASQLVRPGMAASPPSPLLQVVMVDFMNALGFYLVVIFLPLYMQVWGRGYCAYQQTFGAE